MVESRVPADQTAQVLSVHTATSPCTILLFPSFGIAGSDIPACHLKNAIKPRGDIGVSDIQSTFLVFYFYAIWARYPSLKIAGSSLPMEGYAGLASNVSVLFLANVLEAPSSLINKMSCSCRLACPVITLVNQTLLKFALLLF